MEENERWERLEQARHERDVPFLLDWLRVYPDDGSLVAKWLADWNEYEAVPLLLRMLGSSNAENRRTGARHLADFGPPAEAREALIDVARSDPDPAARAWALAALGKYRDPGLFGLLSEALSSSDWRVRNGGAVAIGETRDPRALGELRTALRRVRFRPVAWYLGRHAIKEAMRIARSG